MEFKKTLVSLVFLVAFAVLFTGIASADTELVVEVNGLRMDSVHSDYNISASAGETLPVRVFFASDEDFSDARVKLWVSGDRDYSVSSERIDVFAGTIYSKLFSVTMPTNIDPREQLFLEVSIEVPGSGIVSSFEVPLSVQRNSYTVDFLDVLMDSRVNAGSNVPVDIVLKNLGGHFAEDTFVKASIPALGIERTVYLGDLSPVDQADPDKEDAVEKRMYLSIPSNVASGLYTIQFEAYNSDSTATVSKKVYVVSSASGNSQVVSSTNLKKFNVGETASYSFTLVNSGDQIKVYNVAIEAPADLTVTADDSVIVVPAGSSQTVTVKATAAKSGDYSFVVNVMSDGDLVKKESFVAEVEGSKSIGGTNATLILTVVLAIVFIVLLVVLIVLLTRKPQKTEEFGESYY
ncbi:MAG: hypothetical protein AABX11_04515 [Nanoarchaeota archaeon]